MSRHESGSTDEQWTHIARLLPNLKALTEGAPKPISNRPVFEGILWVLRIRACGKGLPDSYHSPSTAGAAYDCGKGGMSGPGPGVCCPNNGMNRANSTGPGPSPTATLPRRKKGGLCRKDQPWKGYEVDCGGRRPRYSSGKLPGLGVPGRNHVD